MTMPDRPPLILASSSPYRRALLERLGLPFTSVSPAVDETPLPGEQPRALVERLSLAKAEAVAASHPHSLVIGSDQVADHDGEVVGKPASHEAAVAQLLRSSGRQVTLYTGLALVHAASGTRRVVVEPFEVGFRELDRDTIERYLAIDKPYDCCGSLRVEGAGISLLSGLRGNDPNALVGLPLIRLCDLLAEQGIRPLAAAGG